MLQLRGKASCHNQFGYNLLPAGSTRPTRTLARLPSAFIVLFFFLKLEMAGRILLYLSGGQIRGHRMERDRCRYCRMCWIPPTTRNGMDLPEHVAPVYTDYGWQFRCEARVATMQPNNQQLHYDGNMMRLIRRGCLIRPYLVLVVEPYHQVHSARVRETYRDKQGISRHSRTIHLQTVVTIDDQ
jgi:hypothetical protein